VWTKTRIEDKSEPAPVNIWAPTDDRGQRNLGTEACGGFFLQKLVHVGASFGRQGMHFTGHHSNMCKMDSHSPPLSL
jgi:hypothetical protein